MSSLCLSHMRTPVKLITGTTYVFIIVESCLLADYHATLINALCVLEAADAGEIRRRQFPTRSCRGGSQRDLPLTAVRHGRAAHG